MNNYEKAFLGVAIILLLVAVSISLPGEKPQGNQTADGLEARGKEIIYDTVRFGFNKTDYTYGFSEKVNGYEKQYTLIRNGGAGYVEVHDQIGIKKIYFAGNRTFLCVEYREQASCSETSGTNDSALKGYYAYLQSLFFSDERIKKEEELFAKVLFENGLITIKNVSEREADGKKCTMVEYSIDYTNMSIADAEKYGFSPNMPKRFDWKLCHADGIPVYKRVAYAYNGVDYEAEITVREFSAPSEIAMPENLSEDAYGLFDSEIEAQQTLSACFERSREERESCVSMLAFRLYMPSLCGLAGSQADQCIIRMMPYLKNESWCLLMSDSGYRDDCYIELAGAWKNSTYCDYLANQSKLELCLNASAPAAPVSNLTEDGMMNESLNESGE